MLKYQFGTLKKRLWLHFHHLSHIGLTPSSTKLHREAVRLLFSHQPLFASGECRVRRNEISRTDWRRTRHIHPLKRKWVGFESLNLVLKCLWLKSTNWATSNFEHAPSENRRAARKKRREGRTATSPHTPGRRPHLFRAPSGAKAHNSRHGFSAK